MKHLLLLVFVVLPSTKADFSFNHNIEEQRFDIMVDIIKNNLNPTRGWTNVILYGTFTDYLYKKLNQLNYTFVTSNTLDEDYFFEEVVAYRSNFIIVECFNFTNFDQSIRQVKDLPNFHPHGYVILYCHKEEDPNTLAKMFYALWYYRAPNVAIFQYNDKERTARLTHYNPYSTEKLGYQFTYGCWTLKNIGMPIYDFSQNLLCEPKCANVSVGTDRRNNHLGTCIGFNTETVPYNDSKMIAKLNMFQDKGKNLNDYQLNAYTTQVDPFIVITAEDEDNFTLESRDGMVWNTLSKLMNFTLHLNNIVNILKDKFNFETNIKQIFMVAFRQGDVFLLPIYQFNIDVVELDNTFPFKDSGVCIMSHRAGFETILIDSKSISEHHPLLIQFLFVVLGIWLVFTLYSALEVEQVTFDLIGKNFMNTIRNTLLINLWKPPTNKSFRIFLSITIWSFFVTNFLAQGAMISFFTALKKGKEVDTFEDVIEKGYNLEGIPSPDIMLPETEERYQIINSRLTPRFGAFECWNEMTTDSRRFCLVDCSVGHFLERNKLNAKGEQYLHIARVDRMHRFYLNLVFAKHSVFTDTVNRYLMIFFEAGFIQKWEQIRYNNIKEEAPVKTLGLDDFKSMYYVYFVCLVLTTSIFIIEIIVGNFTKVNWKLEYANCKIIFYNWKIKMINKRKQKKVTKKVTVSTSTQTFQDFFEESV